MRYRTMFPAFVLLAVLACSDDAARPPSPSVASVQVQAPSTTLRVGQLVQLTATALDGEGGVVEGASIRWSSESPTVVAVSGSGRATALKAGEAVVSASVGERTGSVTLEVLVVAVARVAIEPAASFEVDLGATVQLRARAFAEDDRELLGRAVGWSSDEQGVAVVDGTGLVTALSAGRARVTASVEGRTAEVEVRVRPAPTAVAAVLIHPAAATLAPGAAVTLGARTFATDGTELLDRPIAWSSSQPSIASVAQDGTVTALQGGTAWVSASSEGVTAEAKVTVTAWASATLRSVEGAAIPAVLRTFPYTDPAGVEVTRTIRVAGGTLRIDPTAGRYEQDLTLQLWEDTYVMVGGQPVFWGVRLVETKTFEDAGEVRPTFDGALTLVFRSELLAGQSFEGVPIEGGWQVLERINGAGVALRLVFQGQ